MAVYLQQIHTLRSTAVAPAFFGAVEADYLPLVERLDVRLAGYRATTSIQGRSGEALAIWEFDDYHHLARLARAEHGTDAPSFSAKLVAGGAGGGTEQGETSACNWDSTCLWLIPPSRP